MPKPIEVSTNAGGSLNAISKNILREQVIESIRQVFDPEIPLNVYDLGLIYAVEVGEDSVVKIVMTLTSPNCPVAHTLPQEVEDAARATAGVQDVNLELTWDPPFSIDMMSDEAKLALGIL